MADNSKQSKRCRVRKGPYKQYLRDSDPFQTAPCAFKNSWSRDNTSDAISSCANDSVVQIESVLEQFENPSGSVELLSGQSKDFQDYENTPEQDSSYREMDFDSHQLLTDDRKPDELSCDNTFHIGFMKDAISQNRLVNDFIVDNDLDDSETEDYETQHTFSSYLQDKEIIESDSEEMLDEDKDVTFCKQDNDNEETVHSHTSLSVGASMLLIMSFTLQYSLTGEGLKDLLSLIELHCPSENKIPKSIGKFRKWFENIKNPLIFHKYCAFCHMYLAKGEVKIETCPNEKCGAKLTDETVSQFIEIPIQTQIETLFSRPGFLQDISYRFNRTKKQQNAIEDIYDGSIYKKLSEKNGVLSHPYNLSLLWNTDGIPCFKSSKMSLWPLFFQINELPYIKRSDPDNMILGGLWFGSKKPTIMCFTEPFLKNLQDLEENGIVFLDKDGEMQNCRVVVIGGTADMPARSLLCNTMQFNGKFGCCKCLQPGETLKTGRRGHVHIFPFDMSCPDGPPRTHAEIINDTFAAVESGKACNGIKGPNFLQCLKYYDLAKSTCIDYMHGVLLGVTKLLLTLWFSTEYSNETFSMSDSVDIVDARLTSIKPPNNIKRTPRSIKEHVKYWKASELRSWLLYYSTPVLQDIQDQEYFKHFLLFVNAIFILLQSSITIEDLKRSEDFLLRFVCMFNAFYGDRYMTCNVHQLVHLPQMVFDMGPLWAYSCFPFENCNGILLKLFHGTQHIDIQIAQTVSLMQRLPELQYNHLKADTPAMELYKSIKGISQKNDKLLEVNICAVGAVKRNKIPQNHNDVISAFLGQDLEEYLTFNRIKIGNDVFHSSNYQRCSVRNSYTVAFRLEQEDKIIIGQVEYYLQLQHCKRHKKLTSHCQCAPLHVALVSCFGNVQDPGLFAELGHIFVIETKTNHIVSVVPLQDILFKCVLVDIKDSKFSYACRMPNNLERD